MLTQHVETLDLLRKGAEQPYYWFEYKREADIDYKYDMMEFMLLTVSRMEAILQANLMLNLRAFKLAARLLMLSGRCKIVDGDIAGGLNDFLAIQRMGEFLNGRGLLDEQLVGIVTQTYLVKALTSCNTSGDISEIIINNLI